MSNRAPINDAPEPPEIDIEATKQSASSFVNIEVGSMLLMGCIMKQAEPTFSKWVDENNAPIYGRVAITAITMYSGTKEDVDRIMKI
jgi:hypothetical protein